MEREAFVIQHLGYIISIPIDGSTKDVQPEVMHLNGSGWGEVPMADADKVAGFTSRHKQDLVEVDPPHAATEAGG